MENKYPTYIWTVKSFWLSGSETYDLVKVKLPNYNLAREYIFNHVLRFFPKSDVRLRVTINLLDVEEV